jgi:hypothetical protein
VCSYAYTEKLHGVEFSIPCTDVIQKRYLLVSNTSPTCHVVVAKSTPSPPPYACIAAKSCGEMFLRRGLRRSPSSLNIRSHSQLEAGIESTSLTEVGILILECYPVLDWLKRVGRVPLRHQTCQQSSRAASNLGASQAKDRGLINENVMA